MSKIMFFCIPAHGHINPTLAVVTELVKRGHQVRYYAMEEFKEKIEAAGAEYISCDQYMPPQPEDLDQKVGKDFASLIEMVVDTTINMDEMMKAEMESFRPDCVVADSVCFWGKLFAKKYGVPFVCSTTTMAFNQHTATLMKQGLGEIIRMFKGMPRINRKMQQLNAHGYPAENFVSIIQNDNDTNTIVYTSRKFQPMVETFSDKYAFVGPSVAKLYPRQTGRKRPQVYISLGTVLHDNPKFYRRCVKALRDVDCDVIISAGKKTDISALGEMPANFQVYPYVNQMEVLAGTDVFLTHCGMNSVNESLYNGVPMVLFPQHSEENAVAIRTAQLGAGVRLKRDSAGKIKKSVLEVITNDQYRKCAEEMSRDFAACGGPVMAAEFIESVGAAH
ncbi:MAG: glucosyltransferase [Lachnospiraceae bacterium]|nr:glucosyltransferase [Lachnospiraceae bacterium]